MTDAPQLPKTTPLMTEVIMNPALTAALFQTYARLFASAWQHEHKYTPWMTQEDLQKLLGKAAGDGSARVDRATIFRRLGAMRDLGLIKWETNKNRMRVYFLEVRPELVAKSQLCDPSRSSRNTEIETDIGDLLLLDQSQKCDSPDSLIDREAWQALREAGFGEPTRSTLADMPHVTAKYIRAMAAQFWSEGFKRSDLGALKYRIENKWDAPEMCERCGGLDGAHLDTCPTVAEGRARQSSAVRERVAEAKAARLGEAVAVPDENGRIWRGVLGNLKLQLTSATFETWLLHTRLIAVSENGSKKFTVECQSVAAVGWLSGRMASMIRRELAGVIGGDAGGIEVAFVEQERAQ